MMKHQTFGRKVAVLGLCLSLSGVAQADILTFDFTGRLVVADGGGNIIYNNGSTYTPISASLTYDTAAGAGSSNLSITMGNFFLGQPATFHDISMTLQSGSDLIAGQVFVDWNGNMNMPLHVEWDATGLLNAIDYGLQVGDKLSGRYLYRDYNADHVWDASELVADIFSATPYSDSLQPYAYLRQGPAPLAATSGSLGLAAGTPFSGIRGYFDIGSGNSMYVTAVSTVPVPAAAWLFGSGLLGLIGVARRKRM